MSRTMRAAISGVLAIVLVALAPGFASYEVAAAVLSGSEDSPGQGAILLVSGSFPNFGLAPISIGLGVAPALSPALAFGAASSFPIASSLPLVSVAGLPSLPVSTLASTLGLARGFSAPTSNVKAKRALVSSLRSRLSTFVFGLSKAKGISKSFLLERFFSGARRRRNTFDRDIATQSAAPSSFLVPNQTLKPAASESDEAKDDSSHNRPTPPDPVVKIGDGLNPGSKLLSGAPQGPSNDDWIDVKGLAGMFIQRSISIALFIQTALAYPLIAIHAVGTNTFGALMALGPLAAIATGPLNGMIADRMTPRNGLIMLSLIRAAQTAALPLLAHFSLLNFWTLLAMSIANGWQLSLLMTSENAYLRRLAGKNHLDNLNALTSVNYLALQVALNSVLGIGALIDVFGPMTPYYISSVALPLIVVPIIAFMVPNTMAGMSASVKAARDSFSHAVKAVARNAAAFIRKFWKEIGAAVVALGVYLGFHTTLPLSAALFWWVSRTDGFKSVWSQKTLRSTMIFSALAFSLIYPFQLMALPLIASALGGAVGKAAVLGQMVGALFFGQLIANASQAKLPLLRLPFAGVQFPAQRLVQGLVLALVAAWSFFRLFPGNWLDAALAVCAAISLMIGASKIMTNEKWVRSLGLGLAAGSVLPFMFWGSLPMMFLGMLGLGLFIGPVQVTLNAYFGKNAKQTSVGNAYGVSSSFNSAMNSFGYGLLTMLVGFLNPAFPRALGVIATAFMVVGAIFFFLSPKFLPGLSKK